LIFFEQITVEAKNYVVGEELEILTEPGEVLEVLRVTDV
jgi:hypothetical protein